MFADTLRFAERRRDIHFDKFLLFVPHNPNVYLHTVGFGQQILYLRSGAVIAEHSLDDRAHFSTFNNVHAVDRIIGMTKDLRLFGCQKRERADLVFPRSLLHVPRVIIILKHFKCKRIFIYIILSVHCIHIDKAGGAADFDMRFSGIEDIMRIIVRKRWNGFGRNGFKAAIKTV